MVESLLALPEPLIMALQLLVTGLMYSLSLKRRKHFLIRCAAGVILFLFLAGMKLGLSERQGLLVQPLIVYALFSLLLLVLFDLDSKMRGFVVISVVATQHMAVAATDTLRVLFGIYERSLPWDLICLLSFAVTLPLCYLMFGRHLRHITQIKIHSLRMIVISFTVFSLVYLLRVFALFQLWELPPGHPLNITINLYDLTGSVAALAILFAGNHEDTVVEENQLIEQLLHEREAQERFTGETIDLVNMKYHDMKHLLSALRAGQEQNVSGVLDEIEQELPRYERVLQTGNAALDTILMNKMAYCESREIRLSCMTDGKQLDRFSSADLYALFGNLLDNAIEASEAEPPGKRTISLQVFEKRGYLCIHVENYCSNPPELENGIPKTRKRDKQYHGFGIKSVRYITEKYGGNLTICTENQRFCVDILIPIP